MATELTPDLLQAIAASDGPLEFIDPQSHEHYVLIPAKMYERLRAALDFGELSEEEKRASLQHWGRSSGWEDPRDSVFDNLKPLP